MPRYTALHTIAADALAYFETARRTTDDESCTFVKLKESAPGWLRDAVREAHGDMLPDDYKFRMAHEACETIAEVGEFGDMAEIEQEFADKADTYTSDLLTWLGSSYQRLSYCDAAISDHGTTRTDMSEIISRGQMMEREEVFGVIREAIENQQIEQED